MFLIADGYFTFLRQNDFQKLMIINYFCTILNSDSSIRSKANTIKISIVYFINAKPRL